jgi:hypothetical protein
VAICIQKPWPWHSTRQQGGNVERLVRIRATIGYLRKALRRLGGELQRVTRIRVASCENVVCFVDEATSA